MPRAHILSAQLGPPAYTSRIASYTHALAIFAGVFFGSYLPIAPKDRSASTELTERGKFELRGSR